MLTIMSYGRNLCKQIKETLNMRDIRVVMCSGLDDVQKCFGQQWSPYGILPKPFHMRQLVNLWSEKLPMAA